MIRRACVALLALAILHGLAALPFHPDALEWTAWLRPAPEVPILLLALLGLGPSVPGRALRLVAVLALVLVSVLRLADLAMLETLGRRFNPVADLPLIDASVRLLAGSLGAVAAVGVVVAAVAALFALTAVSWWATGIWMRLGAGSVRLRAGGLSVAAALVLALVLAPFSRPAALTPLSTIYVGESVRLALRTVAELRHFRLQARQDRLAGLQQPLALIDRDVLVIFLESYGRTSFDTPFFARQHLATLADAQARLERAGLAMRSGFATSPTHGGQSWLAHATLANGLWINDQTRHQAAIASGRQTLFHYAAEAGFRTAAVMPAIVRPWPEAQTMGFQRILTAADLGYRGLPFNWVTMPDQFTLEATDRLLRGTAGAQPLFAQIALLSSHAPWTPVPRLVAWDQLGDGRIFNQMAQEGDPPRVVWSDRDRVRAHYRDTIDYTLRTVMEYAARQGRQPPLMLLIGDHQAATSIALEKRREVPVHVIGPAALVERTAEWGLMPGLIPPADSVVLPMESLRDRFLQTFSGSGDAPA